MAHQIDESNNRANMAYVGKVPWHGLGQQIDANSTIEEWKIAAGLDWHIQKRPIFYGVENADGSREPHVIPDRFAHVRSDTQAHLGIGSSRFQLMQPGDTLEFYRDLVDGSRFTIETAGALNGGAKLWALARCNLDSMSAENYLSALTELSFLTIENEDEMHCRTTEKGLEFLKTYHRLRWLLFGKDNDFLLMQILKQMKKKENSPFYVS